MEKVCLSLGYIKVTDVEMETSNVGQTHPFVGSEQRLSVDTKIETLRLNEIGHFRS